MHIPSPILSVELRVIATSIITAIAVALYYRLKLQQVSLLLEKSVALREQERKGRINVEKEIRVLNQNHQEETGDFSFISIAHVKTPFRDRRGTPRQGSVAPLTVGKIVFNPQIVSPTALEFLDQFSHIWLIFVFHENTNDQNVSEKRRGKHKKTFQAKICPPRLMGAKVGIFSTRSPHRPNPIGLTMVKLESVQGNSIYVSGIDLVDGTPLLDIKPVIPYDTPQNLLVPDWIHEGEAEQKKVIISNEAIASLKLHFDESTKLSNGSMYDNLEDYCAAASQILSRDIRSVHQGRGKTSDEVYECVFDGIKLLLRHSDSNINILNTMPTKTCDVKSFIIFFQYIKSVINDGFVCYSSKFGLVIHSMRHLPE